MKCTANDAKDGECTACYKQRKNEGIRTFSADNNMDPFPNGFPRVIFDLQLTPIEEMLNFTPVIDVANWREFTDWRLPMDVQKIVG